MSPILPITKSEFGHFYRQCTPPNGWQRNIAVAHSAGADSTCLLFLVRQLVGHAGLPRKIHSMHVNHGLQDANSEMVDVSRTFSTRMRTVSHTLPVQWGKPPFPEKPVDGAPSEEIARNARYQLLFNCMRSIGLKTIAFGHHADDQAETALMRWAHGSSPLGLAGSRRVRRWGMGNSRDEDGMDAFGLQGMDMWVIRPLLSFSKDRILATCEANKLEYVEDSTNFQPALTLRNEIRNYLSRLQDWESVAEVGTQSESNSELGLTAGKTLRERLTSIRPINDAHPPFPFDLYGNKQDMHNSVRELEFRLDDIETQVDTELSRITVHSPPGTILITTGEHTTNITSQLVQQALVMRALRAVSPEPWGSPASQAHRRTESIRRICRRLFTPYDQLLPDERKPVMAGASVIWQPMRICPDGRLRHFIASNEANEDVAKTMKSGDRVGWLGSRATPMSWSKEAKPTDISGSILDAYERWSQNSQHDPDAIHEVLWDKRFAIRIRLARTPDAVFDNLRYGARILVKPEGSWWWPCVVMVQPHAKDVLLARISAEETRWMPDFTRLRGLLGATVEVQDVEGKDWMDFKFARPLDAV